MYSSKKLFTFAPGFSECTDFINRFGEVLEWLKRHAWKACSRQNWLAGSNPVLSASNNRMGLMKRLTILIAFFGLFCFAQTIQAQDDSLKDSVAQVAVNDSVAQADSIAAEAMLADDPEADFDEEGGFHKQLKTKFIDGNAGFMSLVALALVLGLAFCIERIIYLTLSEIKAYKLMDDIETRL